MKNKLNITEEEKLILLAQADRKNFQPLYEKYFDRIFWFILKRTGNESLSGDICQQVFFQAMVHLKKYKFKGFPFSSWLYKIALNEVNQYYRKTKNKRYVELDETHMAEVAHDIHLEKEDPIKTNELLIKLLATLNEGDLNIIEMKYFEEKSFREIGEILSLKESATKVRAHRIMKKLRTALKSIQH